MNQNKTFPAERDYHNFKNNYCSKIEHKASECKKEAADRKG